LATPSADAVTDFSRRSEEVSKHLKSVIVPSDTLEKLEKTVLPSVIVTSYDRSSDGKITLKLNADSVKTLAQQLLAFKKSFTAVTNGAISVETGGTFQAEVSMVDTLPVK